MKLLLTSGGVRNEAIAQALVDMTAKPASETKVCFIPTAANVETGNKDWYIGQFLNLWRFGFSWIDIVDPSAGGVSDWKTRLAEADVIFVSGGNTFHLLEQSKKSGFIDWLAKNLKDKVYVGSSAGSLFATPTIAAASLAGGDQNLTGLLDLEALSLVPFEFIPHVPSSFSLKDVEAYA
ncbi:MAG: Type 1 glutamine amidotransferase-like domain-containing protein, partial [Patescibacteria group bacterium]